MKKQFLLWAALGLVALQACHHEEMPVVVDSGTCGGDGSNLTWTLTEDGTLPIRGEGEMAHFTPPPYNYNQEDWSPWYNYREDVERVVIDEGVTSIGRYAFSEHTNLALVTIPSSVTSISELVFWQCGKLTAIQVDAANPEYCSQDGVLFSKDKTSLYVYPGGLQGEYAVPDGVTSIESCAFSYCTGLISVTIPDGVTSIENSTFYNCTSLTSLDIPDGVTSIGNSAFSGCTSLTSVDIPDGVTSIGGGTFVGCTSLASVDIPDAVASIGWNAFYGCTSLTSVDIPGSVTSIGEYAFYGCTSLTSANILGDKASIGEQAFRGCSNLTSLTVGEGVMSIEYGAFNGCTSLASITLPESVTSVGIGVFDGTAFYNDESNWTDGVLYINYCLIEANREKVAGTYAIKPGTRAIAGSAFEHCDLTAVTIPEGVVSIGDEAFQSCTRLGSLTIPSSVTNIGTSAFGHCINLASIVSYATMPPNLVSDTFNMVDRSIPVYVPAGSVTYYQSHPYWGEFNIQPILE